MPQRPRRTRNDISRIVEGQEITSVELRERVREFGQRRKDSRRVDFNVSNECCSCHAEDTVTLDDSIWEGDAEEIAWNQCS